LAEWTREECSLAESLFETTGFWQNGFRQNVLWQNVLWQIAASWGRRKKDYFFDKKKVQLFFTFEFHAAVRGE
jgi:hypothetical protein